MNTMGYKPMNKCPECGNRDFFIKEIDHDRLLYTLQCDCRHEITIPRAQLKFGVFSNEHGGLLGYYHWTQEKDIILPIGTVVNWETLEVA